MNIVSNMSKGSLVKIVGIPKTIDNDTPITEFSVGFQTAVQYCTTSIDSLELTARSHNRAMITEVMGRDAGHLALHSALAGKADVCLIPEIPYTIDGIIKKLKEITCYGKGFNRLTQSTVFDHITCAFYREIACSSVCACVQALELCNKNTAVCRL